MRASNWLYVLSLPPFGAAAADLAGPPAFRIDQPSRGKREIANRKFTS